MIPVSDALRNLRDQFRNHSFDLRMVGGCVRDWLVDPTSAPNDFDLCTDANPAEQKAIYETYNVRHIETGVSHGTWTVVLDCPYEITSLRTESEHDGRHAKVSWTRDWLADLARRDLTFNAMALTFDGELIDPYHGADDLKASRVRFVGRAEDRVREDYLRILRFFRFQARFGAAAWDEEAYEAAQECAPGLVEISRERIWSEISKLLSIKPSLLIDMIEIGLLPYIGLPKRSENILGTHTAQRYTQDPASLMAVYLGNETSVHALAADWKWSNDERKQAAFIVGNRHISLTLAKKLLAIDGVSKYWLAEAFRVDGSLVNAQMITEWAVPSFPVGGNDLLARDIVGLDIGKTLKNLKSKWEVSNFRLDKDELLSMIEKDT